MDVDAIARALKRRARELGITLTEVHVRSGVSQSQISLMANAKGSSYRPKTLAKVSEALAWPSDMLERIGAGDRYPEELSEEDNFAVVIRLLRQLTEAVGDLSDEIQRR